MNRAMRTPWDGHHPMNVLSMFREIAKAHGDEFSVYESEIMTQIALMALDGFEHRYPEHIASKPYEEKLIMEIFQDPLRV